MLKNEIIIKIKFLILRSRIFNYIMYFKEIKNWIKRNYSSPSPSFIKRATLARHCYSGAAWVETGTYLGLTAKFLSNDSRFVYTIEPDPVLFNQAENYLRSFKNIKVINGTSEQVFPVLLPKLTGNVNFWLDGHYSGGFTYKGDQDTPILDELGCVAENLHNFGNVCVMIDDIRCFNPSNPAYKQYPDLNVIVKWATENNLDWSIEHDIFIAKRFN